MGDAETATLFAVTTDRALVRAAEAAGWRVTVDPGGERVGERFLRSNAAVALIDADVEVDAFASAVRAAAAALLIVGGSAESGYAAGATHVLADARDQASVAAVLRFAGRYARRLRGERGERRALPIGWIGSGNGARIAGWIDERLAAGEAVTATLIALSRLDIANAAHGRPGGDALIGAMAGEIADVADRCFGADAAVARVGGAEFVLAMAGDDAQVDAAIGLLGEALARPVPIDGVTAVLGSRQGIARHAAGDDAAALLRRATDALGVAKVSDGSTIQVAAPEHAASAATLAVDLHHAIDRGEIDVRFQPQVEIATGRIAGVEALARWDHPVLGSLGADALFAAADRADLGMALSDHLQQLVLARVSGWTGALGAMRVSLNLTAADVARPGFAALFLARVDASGFPRGRLTIEITETGLMRELATVASLLAELRGAGCRVAIDDFGTGYSSLAYLKSLPLDYLKIDKALTVDIDGAPRDRVVVRGVIAMARALGIATIAEGVETEAQRALLAADGCDYYQGFLLAPPLDEAALLALVEGE